MSKVKLNMDGIEKCFLCGKYYDEEIGCECWEGENAEDECVKCEWCGEYFQNCLCDEEVEKWYKENSK
ncbi:hypothetical protein CUN38_04995 [Enterococcus faecium]|uniref:hypothetical protein n=1 Tax=Enterococcus faecium TaxID=1352 RepID=UPI000CF0EAFC|nr:hypothetical protein [Enterococcus faecium]PQC93500.1 hypothetical protein CUN38_04995 [Enterococcus faecium]